jgi:excisionase family DNA binding protein
MVAQRKRQKAKPLGLRRGVRGRTAAHPAQLTGGGGSTPPPDLHPLPSARPILLDAEVAAKLLSISVSTLYRYVRNRRIPAVYLGSSRRFRLVDLEGFAASLSNTPPTSARALGARKLKAA